MKHAIEIKDLSFSYFRGQRVIENVYLNVEKNDFLGVIGPNGGGKTTLLKLVLGLLKPSSGEVKVFGKSPEEGRKNIGYVPQYFNFDFDFPISVMETVLMGRLSKTVPGRGYGKNDLEIAKKALREVEMQRLEQRQIGTLSGGQRQRVLIARAMAAEPKALLLDEPVSGIDPAWQEKFYELLKRINKKMAIVMVTHNMGFVSSYVEKIACLNITMYYHGSTKEGIEQLSNDYKCPVEMIAHGIPHRVLKDHKH